ncbi:Uncharacterised protein [Bordetella pertussis]|nr:Uncharacterised protein [Bordetella pertussis]
MSAPLSVRLPVTLTRLPMPDAGSLDVPGPPS